MDHIKDSEKKIQLLEATKAIIEYELSQGANANFQSVLNTIIPTLAEEKTRRRNYRIEKKIKELKE